MFLGAPASCLGFSVTYFGGYLQHVSVVPASLQGVTYQISGASVTVFMLHAVFLRVVVASDLWKESWVLVKGSRLPEGVSAVGLESLQKKRCVQKRKESE